MCFVYTIFGMTYKLELSTWPIGWGAGRSCALGPGVQPKNMMSIQMVPPCRERPNPWPTKQDTSIKSSIFQNDEWWEFLLQTNDDFLRRHCPWKWWAKRISMFIYSSEVYMFERWYYSVLASNCSLTARSVETRALLLLLLLSPPSISISVCCNDALSIYNRIALLPAIQYDYQI